MAYVVIQHLPLDDAGLLAEIIGRCTTIKVHQIEDGTTVESDHVYLIRPGRMVTLADGRLCLGEPVQKRGHRGGAVRHGYERHGAESPSMPRSLIQAGYADEVLPVRKCRRCCNDSRAIAASRSSRRVICGRRRRWNPTAENCGTRANWRR
jgi:chemotaxis response regulator CheB